ncbi:lamin tail domain-containing protein [Agromyces subbeticus]|uniref:lamin tail domain-containing protein n=1 Tax=Agromyces subbeticus TaxID=293890 RepID=UPI001FDF6E25|nr:lamin tail domain-containing protein [Agromyces subbeticus]
MPVPRSVRRSAAMLAALAVSASGIAIAATPSIALGADPDVVINEIWYDGSPADAIELYNSSAAAVDVSDWKVQDEDRDPLKTGTIPAGTRIEPGGYLVLAKDATPLGFPFGLGKGDEVVLLDAAGAVVDNQPYEATAPLSDWSRCADGGEWAHATEVTLGAANVCAEPDPEPGSVLLNEIDSGPADWIELINPGAGDLDLSGYEIRDNSDDHRWFFAPGTTIAAGARLVVEASTAGVDVNGAPQVFQAAIGIGGSDSIRLYDAAGTQLDIYAWAAHPAIDGDEAAASWARCPDATGGFALAKVTKGEPNICVLPSVAVNEVESNGDATDWVEVVNTGSQPIDLTGWTLMDSDPIGHATDVTPVAAGTTLAPGAFFVFDGGTHFGFGLGGADVASIRNAAGLTVVEYAWADHAAVTWARCPDGTGDFAAATLATKGQPNSCGTGEPDPTAAAWPGSADVTVIDEVTMFEGDSSGLDAQQTADGVVLWAVDNGTGLFWKLDASADGSAAFADGWSAGKRVRFQRDAENAAAAGPDAEGITVDDAGRLYIASERDNSNKGVNQNVILAVGPDAEGPDVVADQEWDLTASLPQVAANTGLEAVEWVPDAALEGLLVDANTDAPYDPAVYAGHGDGLFFVAVEDNGVVYAYALNPDGTSEQVAAIDPGLGGVMALDYDTVLDRLWALCDNGCDGRGAGITFTGAAPTIELFARPAGMPNLNNEGFATAPASLSAAVDAEAAVASGEAAAAPLARVSAAADAAATVRPAWWFADGEQPAALRAGTVPGAVPGGEPGGQPGTPGGGNGTGGGNAGSGSGSASGSAGALASTGVDSALLTFGMFAALAVALGAAMLLLARRRQRA